MVDTKARLCVVVVCFTLLGSVLVACSPVAGGSGTPSPLPPTATVPGETVGTPLPRPSPTLAPAQSAVPPSAASVEPGGPLGFSTVQPSPTFSSPPSSVQPTQAALPFVTTTIAPSVAHVIDDVLVDGQRVFFTQNVSKQQPSWFPNTLYEYDLRTGKTALLTTSVYGDQGVLNCLALSDSWVSWVTNLPDGSHWQLFARSLQTGEEIVVDREEDTGLTTASTLRRPLHGALRRQARMVVLPQGRRRHDPRCGDPVRPLDA